MRRIILLLLIACARLHAQNIEGQIVASQFGQFQVPGTADGSLQFSPASCQVSGGGKIFSAFEAGVPIKIVDSNPGLTEIDTPTSAVMNPCFVAMNTAYLHSTPFYLTSGTGGLQEALSNGIREGGGPNSVILNADWYTQVLPGNPATVIASVKGNSLLGLVDVTTTPYTYYQWNGSNYAAMANGGGATLPSTGIVFANNTSMGATATSAQIVAALNTGPTTLFTPSILPLGTNSTIGAVRSDGATTSISGSGVISAIPPTGAANLIVATPNGSSGSAAPRAMVAADMPQATSSAFGAVKPDNTTITIAGGVISSVGGGGGAPGGSPTNVQFYGASTFAGDSTFTFNSSTHALAFQNGTSSATAPAGDNSTKVANTAAVFNSQPALLAQYFGAYGDAYGPPDGCAWTASSTTLTCPDGVFQSTAIDGGKQVWLHGAGPAGVAFNTTIVSVTSNTVAVMAAAPSSTSSNVNANTVFGHDDTAAVQACWQYSASNGVQCTLRGLPAPNGGSGFSGFLIGSAGLKLVSSNGDTESSATSTTGSSSINGTNLFCEYNGDCVSLAPGPIPGAVVSNINLEGDPTQPNGRGFHFNASGGSYGNGGLWFSTFTNIQVAQFNQECMLSEGGNYASGYVLPNQVNTFINFNCNAPNQMHTANLIKMTGQHAQILFMNGQTNGPVSASNQPNAMILITEQTTGQADSATDVKFFGYTYEVATIGLQLGNGALNIHYDNGYVENVAEPLIAGGNPTHGGVFGLTYNGNHIANSGNTTAVAQFTGGVTGSMRDNLVYGGAAPDAALAVCTGATNTIDFVGNNATVTTTTGCATSSASPSTSTLTITGGTSASVAASGTPILTINAPGINSGKTLTLYAAGTFTLGAGGNINLGGLTSPLVVSSGGSVTLTLLDQGTTWLVTSTTAGTSVAARKGTFTCTAGGTITIANTNETATSDVVISLNTAGGTISTPPAMKTATAGTGFTVLCGAADTSTYIYDILN